jgi:periplasmic protein CpxP/Spy
MKLNFKNTLIATSIAAGLFGVSAFAVAQNADGRGPTTEMRAQHMAQNADGKGDMQGKHRADRMAKMQKHMAERQAKLKAELKLAPEQEAAWTAFVTRTAHEPRMAGKDGMQREDMSKLTTPERIDKMMAMHAERSAEMTKRMEATKSFYAALTPEQQKTFDGQHMGGFQRMGMKGGERGMGKHRHGDHGHGMHKGEGKGKGMMAAPAEAATPAK